MMTRRFFNLALLSLFPASFAVGQPIKTSAPMRIGVIGAGWMGGTVGRQWVNAGHEVMFSSRHPEQLQSMVNELGARATAGTPRQAAEFGDILLFTVPYQALPDLARDLADTIRGKIVLDACNPSSSGSDTLTIASRENGVARTTASLLPDVRLVRAFSSVDATAVDASARRQENKLAVPIASDDEQALEIAAQLVRDAGCEPLIVGGLDQARSYQRGGPGFRVHTTVDDLRQRLGVSQ